MPTRKWSFERLVNANLAGDQDNSSVARLAGGGFVIVWQDSSGADSVIFGQRYDATGDKMGAVIAISSFTGDLDDQTEPNVTGLADGGFFVSWRDTNSPTDHDINGAVFNASGGFVRSQISDGGGGDTDDVSVARLGAGSVAAWTNQSGDNFDISFRIFDATGIGGSIITANTVTTAFQARPSVSAAPDASKFAVVWDSNFDFTIKGRLFTPAGAEFAPEFQIASSAGSLGVADPVVAWLNDNEFAVVWREFNSFNAGSNQIRVKIFDGQSATPVALTGSILVNSVMAESQQDPHLTVLPNGGFVVSWEDTSGVGGDDGFAIKLQAFDGAGGKTGGEMLVNTTTTGSQFDPSVAALADGRVVVSWTDSSSGNNDIRMQIVDPRDGIVNGAAGNDKLYGHDAVGDEINGFAGADTMYGLAGSDAMYGGEGSDAAYGGRGDDIAYGGGDADVLIGDAGDDELFGEDGNDDLRGGLGADALDGGAGNDLANYGLAPASVTAALDGSAAGAGEALGDTFVSIENLKGANIAGAGDRLTGGSGDNTIFGNDGNDIINGRGGLDKLVGGLGADILRGELGDDRFIYNALAEGGDTIADFTSNAAGNNDLFQFKASAVGGGLAVGALAANQFAANASGLATLGTHRFVYDTDDEVLRFDSNGSDPGGATIIATLQNGAALVIGDIAIF